ncbi:alpha-galactosidase [Streptococcus caprae]|uniref:Alpha-galactosidase n=1 Tax=Streptococcus caprae TaxID=1640501 RepID=A0ABV8CWK3_9STRE
MIEFIEEQALFHLKTKEFSYILQVQENKQVVHRYFGKRISHFSVDNKIPYRDRAFSPSPISGNRTYSLDTLLLEYSSNGLGDFRSASVDLRNEFGIALDLKYRNYEIFKGKKILENLPASYGSEEEVETLELELYDSLTDITVILSYSVFESRSMLARSVRIKTGSYPTKIEKVMSFTLDLPHDEWEIHSLTGRYAYEKEWTRTSLTSGKYSIGSIRGASSHSRTPFLALAEKDIREESGEIYWSHLVYSGNFTAFVESSALHTTRWGMGINDESFSWVLGPNETFQAPEALLSYTDKGLSGMTQINHEFIKNHIVRGKFAYKERPILLNNWEATYFDFTEESILDLAQVASKVGVELLVLDDGWFGRRNSDESSLGDWTVNLKKLPNNLSHLAQEVNDLGMQFGLWFEPEMVSEDSELYRTHPEWAIQIKGRSHVYSREQLVLDLSQLEVCDYIVDAVSKVLHSANISYVKWDMNRNITNIPETMANGECYEFHHRYILGLYNVLERLTTAFPDILFESCSGGGGRNDLGLLYYMPQAWASDNTDAIERLSIQEGTSLIYPVASIGAHVSATPNHQVGRITPIETRGNVAMMGNLGYELNLMQLNQEELSKIKEQIITYKTIRHTVQYGQLYRLKKTTNTMAVNYVNEDRSQVVFTFVKKMAVPEAPYLQVKLRGLNPNFRYYCEQLDATFYGDELMNVGVIIPYVQKDFYSVQYIFKSI